MELHRCRPWMRVPADTPFLVRLPGEELPLVAVVTGQSRTNYGVLLLRGHDAFERIRALVTGELSNEDALGDADCYTLCFDPLGSIPVPMRAPLEAARFSCRREQAAPHFTRARPGEPTRAPSRAEMRTLIACLRAIVLAHESGELPHRPLDLSRQRVTELELADRGTRPTLTARRVPWPHSRIVSVPASVLALDDDLERLPAGSGRWLATLFAFAVGPDEEEHPLRFLAIAEAASEDLLALEIVPTQDLRPVADQIARLMREAGSRPEAIAFCRRELHDALAPALAALGVRCSLGAAPLWLDERLRELLRDLEHLVPPRETLPETLEEWKQADRDLAARLSEEVQTRGLVTARALKRYFGSEQAAAEILTEMEELGAFPALVEWLVADYRATVRSRTWLEKLLEGRPCVTERALIEARQQAELSIYRIDSSEAGALIRAEDVFSGEPRTIHDRALSGLGLEGWCLPLRLLRLGEWIFPVIAGPPFSPLRLNQVLDVLESIGVDLSPGGLRRSPDLVGALWAVALEMRRHPPRLQNTDGEPLEMWQSSWRVVDAGRFLEALRRQPEVDFEPERGSGAWTRPDRGPGGLGRGTILAHLELVADTLLVSVNSRGRLERARAWLRELPGLRLEGEQRREAGEAPLDDRLPGPPETLPQEVLDAVGEQFHAYCRRWLDEPLPVLGGRSPRQACRSGAGRRKVAQLVRTMPPLSTPAGPIHAPREELLRELGLA